MPDPSKPNNFANPTQATEPVKNTDLVDSARSTNSVRLEPVHAVNSPADRSTGVASDGTEHSARCVEHGWWQLCDPQIGCDDNGYDLQLATAADTADPTAVNPGDIIGRVWWTTEGIQLASSFGPDDVASMYALQVKARVDVGTSSRPVFCQHPAEVASVLAGYGYELDYASFAHIASLSRPVCIVEDEGPAVDRRFPPPRGPAPAPNAHPRRDPNQSEGTAEQS